MTACHTIRLHAAWKRVVPAGWGAAEQTVAVSLPDAELPRCTAASVTYHRGFNRPTGLAPQTVVHLDCGLLALASDVQLNGQPLPPGNPVVEVTSLLQPHNVLEIVVPRKHFKPAAGATAMLRIETPAASPDSSSG